MRWRLWMLLTMLGIVIIAMRHLNSPDTAEQFGQLFTTPPGTPVGTAKQHLDHNEEGRAGVPAEVLLAPQTSAATEAPLDALAQVEDNTYFRPVESEAWFELFQQLQQQTAEQLRAQSLGELTYAQLLEQPDAYRGKLVTVRGTLRREQVETAPDNSLGIKTYHRLVIQPRGGGHWPFVVYCLELPSTLPRGDQLREPIEVSGYFFKNWSYAWQNGLGVAPVILARDAQWHPANSPSPNDAHTTAADSQPMHPDSPVARKENSAASFRDILTSAGISTDELVALGEGQEYDTEDWQLLLRVFHRLEQFRDLPPAAPVADQLPGIWLEESKSALGEIFEVAGRIDSVEKIALPESLARQHQTKTLYRCQFQFSQSQPTDPARVTILTTSLPSAWKSKAQLNEPVSVRGVLVHQSPVLLTHHIAWFPIANVPMGQLLLARHGMDISLLDEVRHRQPFVTPEIAREGEAFYAALCALRKAAPAEILNLARENVKRVANAWQEQEPELVRAHQQLEAQLAAGRDDTRSQPLLQELKQAKTQRGIAAAVAESAQGGLSSVAPMFLQPQNEIGALVVVEGTARRAVRVLVEDQPQIDAYYELELFTNDSQNLPVVCCVTQLPEGFPTGDEIREPLRLAGVFFKSWRYRSRELGEGAAQSDEQRRMVTPVVLGHAPTWLRLPPQAESRWGLWGGISFLVGLVLLWLVMMGLARRDRRARAALRLPETIQL